MDADCTQVHKNTVHFISTISIISTPKLVRFLVPIHPPTTHFCALLTHSYDLLAVPVLVLVVAVVTAMGVYQVVPVHVPPLELFLPVTEPSFGQPRVGAAIGPLLLIVCRLTGQLGHRTAMTKRRTHQILEGEGSGNSVFISDGTPESGQDQYCHPKPKPGDGLEKVGVVAGTISGIDVVFCVRGCVLDVVTDVLDLNVVVQDILEGVPPYRIVRGVGDGDAVLQPGSRIHNRNG